MLPHPESYSSSVPQVWLTGLCTPSCPSQACFLLSTMGLGICSGQTGGMEKCGVNQSEDTSCRRSGKTMGLTGEVLESMGPTMRTSLWLMGSGADEGWRFGTTLSGPGSHRSG